MFRHPPFSSNAVTIDLFFSFPWKISVLLIHCKWDPTQTDSKNFVTSSRWIIDLTKASNHASIAYEWYQYARPGVPQPYPGRNKSPTCMRLVNIKIRKVALEKADYVSKLSIFPWGSRCRAVINAHSSVYDVKHMRPPYFDNWGLKIIWCYHHFIDRVNINWRNVYHWKSSNIINQRTHTSDITELQDRSHTLIWTNQETWLSWKSPLMLPQRPLLPL